MALALGFFGPRRFKRILMAVTDLQNKELRGRRHRARLDLHRPIYSPGTRDT